MAAPAKTLHAHKVSACRFDYEYMGKSVAELASMYGFNLVSLEEEIEDHGWYRKLEPTSLPQTNDMQQFADQLEKITRSKLSIVSLFRQIDNQSLYAELEKALLVKALEMVGELSSMDDKAANKLVNITKTLTAIQERNPIQLADTFKDTLDSKGSGIVVNIANQIQ